MVKKIGIIGGLFWAACLVAGTALAQSPVILTVDTQSPGQAIPEDYSGVSFGTVSLKPGSSGYFFDSSNTQVLTLFHELGIKFLRLGGTSVDTNNSGYFPATADVDALFRFAGAAGVKVVYSLRLMNGDADQDAAMADYIWNHYRQYLDCFAIGNEPDVYKNQDPDITNYTSYHAKWTNFATTILGSVPDAKFGGPDGGSGTKGASWGAQFASDQVGSGIVKSIFFHYYVGGSSANQTPQQLIDEMLSEAWVTNNLPVKYAATGAPVLSLGFPYRFTEANSYFTGGTAGVPGGNNCYATALFALEDLYWWTLHQCQGLCFHTAMWKYNGTFYQDTNGDYQVYPMGYGIKAFDLGGHGFVQPLAMANPDGLNLSAYPVRDGTNLYVTIINKEHGPDARSAAVTIMADDFAGGSASVMFLLAPDNDPAATSGITLGGAPIVNDGSWLGQWTQLGQIPYGQCPITVPPASAAIVRIQSPTVPGIMRDLPARVTLVAGKSYCYSVDVRGTTPFSYQWYLDGNSVAGSTNTDFRFSAGPVGSLATISVVITNSYGAVTSTVSTVTVVPPLLDYHAVQVLGREPAAYWPLQETAAPVAANYGSVPVDGFYMPGSVPGGTPGPAIPSLGTNSVAAALNGLSGYIDAGNDPVFNPVGMQPFTAMTWFRTYPSDTGMQALMSHGAGLSWSIALDGADGHLIFSTGAGGSVTSRYVYNDGTWHHVTVVYDGSRNYLYVDGAPNNSTSVAGGILGNVADHLYLGGDPDYPQVDGNERYFAGALAHAAFFTNALTMAQVQAIYQAATVAPPPDRLVLVNGSGGALELRWNYGTLQSATNIAGPYRDVPDAFPPCALVPTSGQQFYRLREN